MSPMSRVGGNPFDNETRSGIAGGRRTIRPRTDGPENYIIRNWRASPEPFSTVLIFGVQYVDAPTANDDPSDALVRIRFGTSSAIGEDDCQVVDVDLFNGAAITVLGNCVLSAEVIYGAPFDAAGQATQPALLVDASVAHGFNPCNARRTIKVGSIAPNTTSPRFPIPLQAREAYLVNAQVAVPALTLTQFYTANGATTSVDVITKKSDGTVQYAHGATVFSLTTGNDAVTKAAVIWKLNL